MRTWTLCLMLVVTSSATRLCAQDVIPPAENILVVPAIPFEPGRPSALKPNPIRPVDFRDQDSVAPNGPAVDFHEPPPPDAYRIWARGEYQVWWLSPAPVPAPLVTTGPAGTIGALNEPGTRVLFGAGSGQDVNVGGLPGGRFTLGGWIEENRFFSWEVSAFLTARRSLVFHATTPGGAEPIVSIPFNATEAFGPLNPAGETSLNAGGAPSNANVQLTSRLWGAEVNQFGLLLSTQRVYWSAFVGFRYLQLSEDLSLTYTTYDSATNGAVAVADRFGTRNEFYAGQVGTRVIFTFGRLDLESAFAVALGSNHQYYDIAGGTNVANGAFGFADTTNPGGVFAQPSNIGSATRTVFTVVPEIQAKASFAITPGFRPFVAFNALYMSNVLRPGDQMDRNINPTQSAFFVPPGTATGTPAPLPAFRSTTLWAHGVQIGMELRY